MHGPRESPVDQPLRVGGRVEGEPACGERPLPSHLVSYFCSFRALIPRTMRVYFDNAATTPLDPEVIQVMEHTMRHTFGNPSSIHAEGRAARALIEQARKTVAQQIGASVGEVFFTSGGTESHNTVLKCSVRDLGVERIISSPTEHHCILHALETLEKQGVEVVLLPVDEYGRVSLEALESALKTGGKKTLVSLMHANNEIGTLLDIDAVGALCKQYGALFHSDTVQTVAHFPIDVQKTPVDFLAGSAHKFHGPKGVGFLYVRSDVQLRPFIDGGSQERNMRGGTENLYGIVGLAKAFELACTSLDARRRHIADLRQYMKSRLQEAVPGIRFNGYDAEEHLYTVLSAAFPPSPKSEMLVMLLDIAGVSASGGSACSSGAETGSHVLKAIGADSSHKTIRFSFSHFNTREEVDFAVEKLKEILQPTPAKAPA